MKGHVVTPDDLVDIMVAHLFAAHPPTADDALLDPGCGGGALIAGVLRWCAAQGRPSPCITGVERNPVLVHQARRRFAGHHQVTIHHADYLGLAVSPQFRFILGNPPYVALGQMGGTRQRDRHRARFVSARGRFDLYMLFFERAVEDLADDGRLVFITPEKFLYVDSATPLRRLLTSHTHVHSVMLTPEDGFPGLTTYPAITILSKGASPMPTAVRLRCGAERAVVLPTDGTSWWPYLMTDTIDPVTRTLGEICVRISAGIATGADAVFVREGRSLPPPLRRFAKPAIAGKDLTPGASLPLAHRALLMPYSAQGNLLPLHRLGALATDLSSPAHLTALRRRTCARRKPWYAFHDNVTPEILRPKIIFKDITKRPCFWVDRAGTLVPLHSVYYLVPKQIDQIDALCAWLNSAEAGAWMMAHCQRAANGYVRLQSHVLRRLPFLKT